MSSSPADPGAPILSECTIQPETPAHADRVETLYDRAFGPGRWAKTAERLREGNRMLETCSLVATIDDGAVVAAVRLWPIDVGGQPGTVFVGPVAVDPDWRGGALGLSMTSQCLDLAREAGFQLAILIGDFPYFGRIGFSRIPTGDYPSPGHVPEGRLMALELAPDALSRLKGPLTVPRAART